MGCVIKHKGQSIPEEQFLQYLNKQIAINNLFNENETFANSVYEALGFSNIFTKDKIYNEKEYDQPTIKEINNFNANYKKDGTTIKVYAATNNINTVLKEGFSGINTGLGTTKGEAKGTVFLTPFLYTATDYGNIYASEGIDINDIGIIEVEINNGAGVVEGDEIRLRKEDIVSVNEVKINKNKGLLTPQQKQQATFMFSEFLDVYLKDFEQVEKILKEEKIIEKKCN